MDLQFYFSNVPSDSNWNGLVLIKNEISARNQWNPRRTDGELFEPSETWWIKTLQFLLEKSLPNCRSENERNILLYSSQASEIAECWSTHHLEWFHFWKFIQGMIFGPIVSERSTPYNFPSFLFQPNFFSKGLGSPAHLFGSAVVSRAQK